MNWSYSFGAMDKLSFYFSPLRTFILLVIFHSQTTKCQITRNIGGLSYDCGGYIQLDGAGAVGTIATPNYPSQYPNLVRCIWLFKAPKEFAVSISFTGVSGEGTVAGGCLDYLEIRSGSSEASLLYYQCNSGAAVTLTADSRWLWVKFESDWRNKNTGFTADYSLVADTGNTDDDNPVAKCFDYEFSCDNKECISWAYRCDGQNDCGCSSIGCDELECHGLSLSDGAKVGVGVGVGVVVFIMVFIGVGLLDICLKRRSEIKYQKQVAEAEKRAKKMKARKMAQNFLMSAAEGAKLNVPSVDLNASMNSTASSIKSNKS